MAESRQSFPPHAKKVFQGVIFEVWQWEQKMFDGRTVTFERLRRPDTVHMVTVVGDKILIETQEQPDSTAPFLSLPGGRCDEGEDPLQAAKRELLEETGYASDDWELWMATEPAVKIDWMIHTFVARNCVYEKPPELDGGERIKSQLISFEEFLHLPEEQFFRNAGLTLALVKARTDPEKRAALERLLFGR